MAISSLTYPGVEIKERDLGTYGVNSAQVKTFVAGFTHKGEIKKPTEIYDMSSYVNQFGEPTNDAEFYTYVAASQAVAAGGVAVVSRIPYANLASSGYRGVALKFGTATLVSDPAVTQFISEETKKALITQFGSDVQIAMMSTSNISISEGTYELASAGGEFAAQPASDDPEDGNYDSIADANFVVIDYKRTIANDDDDNGGLFYVFFDPIIALRSQRLIESGDKSMNCVTQVISSTGKEIDTWNVPLSGGVDTDSISRQIARQFPTFTQTVDYTTAPVSGSFTIERTYNNTIGVAVCRIGKSDSAVAYQMISVVEVFVGSVIPSYDQLTRQSRYIVDIVNYSSNYIRMFANRLNQVAEGKTASGTSEGMKPMPLAGCLIKIGSDLNFSAPHPSIVDVRSFAFGSDAKLISGSSINGYLLESLKQISDVDSVQVDIICDAGLSSIANFVSNNHTEGLAAYYEPDLDITDGVIESPGQLSVWSTICNTLEQFCSGTRKDCVALLDAPRNATLKGSQKLVRDDIKNSSFSEQCVTAFNTVAASQNSSYSAMFANWVQMANPYTGKNVWVPPSCFVAYSCSICDLQYNSWDAPAFLERGTISGIIDISLIPDAEIESFLYPKSINYIKYFSSDGYVIWGQKTTQKTEGAFSRLNVRRSILRHERYIRQTLRQFIGENNTTFTRRSAIDAIDPYMRNVKAKNGVYDYLLVCDTSNNPPEVIDANEMAFAALMQPVKTAEKIVATIAVTNTGADLTEYVSMI